MTIETQLEAILLGALAIALAVLTYQWTILQRLRRPHNTTICHKCGFDIRASVGGRCPECGEPATINSAPPGAVTHCSFCNGSSSETGPQAEGPGTVRICWVCAEKCHEAIQKNRAQNLAEATEDVVF